ncbi:MAG: HlyD family secretion protein [Alkalinema sp. CACIAM 70d]|nr:MAG: HlyD family secretion protein [Alkalinema sp. CACIAM 70d]
MEQSINPPKTYEPDGLTLIRADEFLPSPNIWIILSGWLVVGSLGLAVGLASISQYNVTVRAQAWVRPVGELRLVQATREGIINQISVTSNQVVKRGDVLATIDMSSLQTKKSQLTGNLRNAEQQLVQIVAQVAAIDQQISSETNLTQWTVSSAQNDLNRNQRDFHDRQLNTEADVREAEAALELAKSEMEKYQQLANTGAVAQVQIVEKEQAFKMAQARLDRAKTALNPSNAMLSIANDRIAQEIARGKSTLAALNKERSGFIQRQSEIQSQMERDQKELQQVESDLQNSLVKTPVDGVVLNLNLRNSGQFVRSGEEIAQIAPSQTQFVVKARIAAEDISKVKTGQSTQLRLSACPYPDYGVLMGKVSAISPDAISASSGGAKTETNSSSSAGSTFYEVSIEPDQLTFGQGQHKCDLKLGMEGRVDIVTKKETVLQYLLRRARLLTDI